MFKKFFLVSLLLFLGLSMASLRTFAYSELDSSGAPSYRRNDFQIEIQAKFDSPNYDWTFCLFDFPKLSYDSSLWSPYYYFNSYNSQGQAHQMEFIEEVSLAGNYDNKTTNLYDESFELAFNKFEFKLDKTWLNYDLLNVYFNALDSESHIQSDSVLPLFRITANLQPNTTYVVGVTCNFTLSEFTINNRNIGSNQNVVTSTYSNEQSFSVTETFEFTPTEVASQSPYFNIIPRSLLSEWDTIYSKYNQFQDSYYLNCTTSVQLLTKNNPTNVSFNQVSMYETVSMQEYIDNFIENFYNVSHVELISLESFLDLAPSLFETIYNALNVKIFGFMSLMDLVIMFVTLSLAFLLLKTFLGG